MNIKEAKAIVGGLSNPSKKPGYGYGLSAFDCAVGSKLRLIKNSTCSMCYALKGRYTFPGVKNAHANRLESIKKNNWVEAMVLLVSNYGKKIPYFTTISAAKIAITGLNIVNNSEISVKSIQELYNL